MSAPQSLTIVRRIKAPPRKIYEAWLDPVKLAKWWGPRIVTTTIKEAEARVGGRYRFLMREAGGREHEVRGVYRELVPGEKLVFTWAFISESEEESLITITLRPIEEGTELTLLHEGAGEGSAWDDRQDGWSRSLVRLERFLAED